MAQRRDFVNLTANAGLVLCIFFLCCWWLYKGNVGSYQCNSQLSAPPVLLFNGCTAFAFFVVLTSAYLDETPFEVKYKVMQRAEIPEVHHSFVHSGRWTTFTIWCNSVGAAYFFIATAVGALQAGGYHDSEMTCTCVRTCATGWW